MRQVSLASLAVSGGFHDGDWVESKDQDPDGEIRLLQLADIGDGFFRDRSDRRINEAAFGRLNCSPVLAGDVLIARMPDPLGRACIVPQEVGRAVTVVDVAVLRCDDTKADRRYVTYAVNAAPTRSFMASLQDGATRQRIPRKRLGRVQIPLPELPEQGAIADFLDRETARIDVLIEEQKRLIEMLRERRDAEADALLGAPSRARHTTVKRVLRPLSRPALSGLGVVTAFRDGVVTLRSNRREDGYTFSNTEHGYQEIRPGDLVFHALDGFAGAVGVSDSHGNATPVYHVCEATAGDDLAYVARLLRYLGRSGFLVTQAPNVRERSVDFRNWAMFGRLPISLPPVEEQRRIASHLDEQDAKTDTLIVESERFVELAQERHAALITAAVTGQIDARGAA
ncbi:restriction endonuclease subunit S [Streptomyces sp. NPDC059695]|uniref:restriction endonuclease subunit S n=1 Tax=Streptomyces sp. NPDC059695 TaxID=3346910 RepID=UPI0036ADFCB5